MAQPCARKPNGRSPKSWPRSPKACLPRRYRCCSRRCGFWPEVFGPRPSLLTGVAVERSVNAALKPASRRVKANFRRLSERMSGLQTAKTAPQGNTALPSKRMALRERNTAKVRLRYARPDPERRAAAMTASQSVLQGHRYRVVIESLSKSKFATFLARFSEKMQTSWHAHVSVAAQETDDAGKIRRRRCPAR